MATGPEHYQQAEDHIEAAEAEKTGSELEQYHLGAAQVHATLALAAATALNQPHPDAGMTIPDWDAWVDAASAYERPKQPAQ